MSNSGVTRGSISDKDIIKVVKDLEESLIINKREDFIKLLSLLNNQTESEATQDFNDLVNYSLRGTLRTPVERKYAEDTAIYERLDDMGISVQEANVLLKKQKLAEDLYNKVYTGSTEENYLAKYGVSAPISDYTMDKTRALGSETERQRRAREKEGNRVADEYFAKRIKYKKEYADKVKRGEIKPPTKEESQLATAVFGHPDNPSVQAARRRADKKGIDWRKYVIDEKVQVKILGKRQ